NRAAIVEQAHRVGEVIMVDPGHSRTGSHGDRRRAEQIRRGELHPVNRHRVRATAGPGASRPEDARAQDQPPAVHRRAPPRPPRPTPMNSRMNATGTSTSPPVWGERKKGHASAEG